MFDLFKRLLSPVYCDAPEPWQIGFQDGASPTFEGITELHDWIFFYLVVIFVGVAWVLGSVVVNFSSTKSPIVYKYANHGFKDTLTGSIIFVLLVVICLAINYTVNVDDTLILLNIAPLPFVSENGKQKVMAVKGKASKVTPETVNITPTSKMLRAMDPLKVGLEKLKGTDNTTVYDWLNTQSEVVMLIKGYLPPITFNTIQENLVAEYCCKGVKPINRNTAGVYLFFNTEDGESCVGSALSFILRFTQHLSFANRYRRYFNAGVPVPKEASSKFYRYLYKLTNGLYSMNWGVLCTVSHYSTQFNLTYPNHILTLTELDVLDKFTIFLVRLHEHVMMEKINPSLNSDSVKFTVNWYDRSNDRIKLYHVIQANTNQVIATAPSKKRLISITGKNINQVTDYLDHEKAFFCKALDTMIVLRTIGAHVPIKTGAVQTSFITTESTVGFDVSTLQDGLIHLLDVSKQLTGRSFPSSTVAAWELDGKTSKMYIHRYVNVERAVQTAQGTFYFVQNTAFQQELLSPFNAVGKPHAGTAGKRSHIIVYDQLLNVYVEFMSKNSLGKFLWDKDKTGGGIFDRYLHNEVMYKNRLVMYFKDTAPANITIITTSQYFELIGSNRFS